MDEINLVRGVNVLWEWGGLVAVLGTGLIVLGALCWYLIRRNQEISDKMVAALIQNTEVIAEFKEVLRESISRRD